MEYYGSGVERSTREIEPDESGKDSVNRTQVRAALKNGSKSRPPYGYLYFIQCNAPEGPVKIGFAKDVDIRLSNIRMSNPYPLTLLGKVSIADPADVEEQLHARFARSRVRGEWFAATPEIIAMAEIAESYAQERFMARMGDRPDPPTPNVFCVTPIEDVEVIDQTIADDVARMIAETRRNERTARRAADRGIAVTAPPPKRVIGQFTWRGKVRAP